MDAVAGLLVRYRLVTVTGPGGVGKTRLAAEVAARTAARFADGIRLAELASVQDQAQVPAAVAAVLGVREAPGASVLELLAGVLGRQQVLLVLDNCEHVLDAVAQLCEAVLPLADDVRVLATSREPIGVPARRGTGWGLWRYLALARTSQAAARRSSCSPTEPAGSTRVSRWTTRPPR